MATDTPCLGFEQLFASIGAGSRCWALLASPVEADYAGITTDPLFTSDKASKDTLTGELGTDWFWSAIAGAVADVTDKAVVERRRLV